MNRRRKFFGEGRERKEEQTLVPLIQFSMSAAEPLEGILTKKMNELVSM